MSTNNEITPVGKSDTTLSKNINELKNEAIPAHSISESEFESGISPFNKLLVTYDGTPKSDKAINYAIYLSNITKAEVVVLQVIGNIDKLENSSIDISNKNKDIESESTFSGSNTNTDLKRYDYSVNIEGNIIGSIETKMQEIEKSGFKNKLSYKIRAGFIVDEIVKETHESKYDLLIISSSHMDSWIKSFFSETRKIIGKVDLPVLLLH
jgi:nucleotide-binding universal stress UspA family protein